MASLRTDKENSGHYTGQRIAPPCSYLIGAEHIIALGDGLMVFYTLIDPETGLDK